MLGKRIGMNAASKFAVSISAGSINGLPFTT